MAYLKNSDIEERLKPCALSTDEIDSRPRNILPWELEGLIALVADVGNNAAIMSGCCFSIICAISVLLVRIATIYICCNPVSEIMSGYKLACVQT